MTTKISKTTWVDCINYQYDLYRMSIRTNFDNKTARSFSLNIAATSEENAKEFMNTIINKNMALVAEDYDKFFEAVVADVEADKTQQKYIISEDEKERRMRERMKELGY